MQGVQLNVMTITAIMKAKLFIVAKVGNSPLIIPKNGG